MEKAIEFLEKDGIALVHQQNLEYDKQNSKYQRGLENGNVEIYKDKRKGKKQDRFDRDQEIITVGPLFLLLFETNPLFIYKYLPPQLHQRWEVFKSCLDLTSK